MKTFTFWLATFIKYSLLITMLFLGVVNVYAQNHRVSGTITHDGVPLLGATVMIKDTQRGTTTDMDGYFELLAKDDAVLVVSYIGYKAKEVALNGRTSLTIELEEDAATLDAVEITGGYYSLDERTITGNVTKIDTDQLEQQVVHSPMEALQGRVAGLEIETRTGLSGQAPLVTLRGQGSIRAFGDIPLYIIDGVPIDNIGLTTLSNTVYDSALGIDPLATLDASIIESIEILKDADATAIYGSRGANGVIIINTKRGQSGKTKFEVQAETGVSWVGKFMNLMNTDQYLEMRREAFENDGVTPTEVNAPDLLLWEQDRYTDWQKELIGGSAEFQKYQGSVSGGNAQTSFLLSGGFQKEGTVFPGDFGFQNNNLHANINHRSENNKLQLNTSINYGYRKSSLFNLGSIFFSTAVLLPPNAPKLFDEKGNINWELDEYGNPTFINPMAGLANPTIMRMQSLQWNGNLQYKLFKGLEVKLNMGKNVVNSDDKQLDFKKNINPIRAATARSTTNQQLSLRNQLIIEPQLFYTLDFNKHQINSLVGSTFQKSENKEMYLRGQGYFSESQVGNIALAEENSILRDEKAEYRYTALFGRIGYSYDNKYYLNLTGRRDGSSRFGKKNRFGNFGAVGAAWEFYKENFIIESIPWLSYGKLRGSYCTTGSDNIGDYQYRDTYSKLFVWPGSLSGGGLIPSKLHNPYYRWEKNTKQELALDIGLWNDRLLLSSVWYCERSGNQLVGMSLPSITGFGNVQGNLEATVENQGLELLVQTVPIQTKNIKWSSYMNLTIPKNKLIAFPNLESSSYAHRYEIGKSLGIHKFYHFKGINPDTGKYTFEDVNDDGVLNYEDRTVIADLSRKLYGGWFNQIQYKNFKLSFLFEFVKQKGLNPINAFGAPGDDSNMPVDILNRWNDEYPDGKHQGFTQLYDSGFSNYTNSDINVIDASFIRMKSLSLNYQLPIGVVESLRVHQGQVYLNAQNLFTFTPYKGYDPQSGTSLSLPALTSIHIGLKLTM